MREYQGGGVQQGIIFEHQDFGRGGEQSELEHKHRAYPGQDRGEQLEQVSIECGQRGDQDGVEVASESGGAEGLQLRNQQLAIRDPAGQEDVARGDHQRHPLGLQGSLLEDRER